MSPLESAGRFRSSSDRRSGIRTGPSSARPLHAKIASRVSSSTRDQTAVGEPRARTSRAARRWWRRRARTRAAPRKAPGDRSGEEEDGVKPEHGLCMVPRRANETPPAGAVAFDLEEGNRGPSNRSPANGASWRRGGRRSRERGVLLLVGVDRLALLGRGRRPSRRREKGTSSTLQFRPCGDLAGQRRS